MTNNRLPSSFLINKLPDSLIKCKITKIIYTKIVHIACMLLLLSCARIGMKKGLQHAPSYLVMEPSGFTELLPEKEGICAFCTKGIFEADINTKNKEERLECGHKYHQSCVNKWIRGSGVCLLCPKKIDLKVPDLPALPSKSWIKRNAKELIKKFRKGSKVSVEELEAIGNEEDLAHYFIYQIPKEYEDGKIKDGDLLPLVDGTYKIQRIKTKMPLFGNDRGLIPFFLTKQDHNQLKARIIFRGTGGWASCYRDLEAGVGELSYQLNRDDLFKQIDEKLEQYLEEFPNNKKNELSVTISGHSLGGADAQRCFTTMLGEMYEHHENKKYNDKYRNPKLSKVIKKIKDISCFHFNSPGVSNKVVENAKKFVDSLHKFKNKCKNPIRRIKSSAISVRGDGVQRAGDYNIFSDVPNNEFVTSEVYKFDIGAEGVYNKVKKGLRNILGQLTAPHCGRIQATDGNTEAIAYEYYDNKKHPEEVKKYNCDKLKTFLKRKLGLSS